MIEVGYNGNHSSRLPIIADYNQALPNAAGPDAGHPAAPSESGLRRHHLGGSGRHSNLQRLLGALRASLLARPVLPELVHLVEVAGQLRAGARIRLRLLRRQSAEHLQSESRSAAPRASTSSSSTPPAWCTSCLSAGAVSSARTGIAVYDAMLGGWQINTINTANTGTPLDVAYTPGAANDVTGRIPDYRGEAIMRPNVVANPSGASGHDQSLLRRLYVLDSARQRALRQCRPQRVPRPEFLAVGSRHQQELPHHASEPACSSDPNFSTC